MTVTRRIDDLGRIVIPKEMRKAMGFNEGEALDITSTYEGKIFIEKAQSISPDEPKVTITNDRKMCIIRYDCSDDDEEVVLLTEEQFRLLDWLSSKDFLDGNVIYYKCEEKAIKAI